MQEAIKVIHVHAVSYYDPSYFTTRNCSQRVNVVHLALALLG